MPTLCPVNNNKSLVREKKTKTILLTEVSKKLTVSPYKDTVFKWGLLDSEQTHH
jgi:hypothetical protein